MSIASTAIDKRCAAHASETLQTKEQMERRGTEADVVIYEDEGHGF